jgi:uncharacterized protein (TIGR02246 family)
MLTAEDKVEIQELSSRYIFATDSGDADARSRTFLPDGVFETPKDRYEGREAIAEQTREFSRREPGESQHWVLNYVIDGDSKVAKASAYVAMVHRSGQIRVIGRYYDVLRKVDGGWLFASRRFEALTGVG